MSYGKLCEAKLKIGFTINTENSAYVTCGLWDGHKGNHQGNVYHCVKRKNVVMTDNYRVGLVEWDDEMPDPHQ